MFILNATSVTDWCRGDWANDYQRMITNTVQICLHSVCTAHEIMGVKLVQILGGR